MANNQVNMPAGFGGLVRYNEEYPSIINLKPIHVVLFILGIIAFRFILGAIFS